MDSAAELKGCLERFYLRKFPRQVERGWKRFLRQNARIKVVSVGLASMTWFLFAYHAETVQRTFAVPVEYRNLPEDWYLEGQKPLQALVTLSGSERAFNLLNPGSLLISLDLGGLREGTQRFVITEKELRRPPDLRIHHIDPNWISLEAYRLVNAALPIRVQTRGELPGHLRRIGLKVLPASVRARVRSSRVDQVRELLTEPIDLTGITQTTLLPARLLLPEDVLFPEGIPPEVNVVVEVAERE